MIGDLDLAYEDEHDHRPRHRRTRRGGRAPRRRSRGRSIAALFLTLLLLVGLGGGAWYGIGKVRDFFSVKDYTGAGSGSANVQVVDGDTATDIANKLYTAGVVKSARAFVDAAKADQRSQQIQAGWYKLRKHMKATLALDMLVAKDANGNLANKVSTKVTIPEGMISVDIYATLSKATNIPVADFKKAADPKKLGVPDWWFKRSDGKPIPSASTPGTVSIEGFLYPATYEFDPGANATDILKTMVKQFLTVTGKLDFANQVQAKLNISPYEALIAASIAQVEAKFPNDMAGVARVLYNRAYTGQFPCNCEQLDSTVNYWLRISGKDPKASQDLLMSELHNANDPYNTHDKPGLPIGPISNPGQDALTGALNPPKTGYLYFVAVDKAGHTAFATTFAQHEQNIALAKKNGVL